MRKAFELDPENKAGMKLAALECLFNKGEAKEAEFAMAEKMDASNEKGLYEKVVNARMGQVRDDESATAFVASLKAFLELDKIHDKESVQMMCVNVAFWCDKMLEKPEDAIFFAKKAQELGELEGRMGEVVKGILEKSAT